MTDRLAAGRTRWDIVALAVAGGVMVGLAVGKVPPAMAVIAEDFGLGRLVAGWLASIFFAFGALLGVFTGMAGGLFGARPLLFGGLLVLAAAGALGAFAPDGGVLLALRVIEGIGFSTITAAAPKLVFDAASGKDRDLALGIWSAYMPAGMALAMVAVPLLLPAIGWRGAWLAGAGVTLVVALLAAVGTAPRRWPEQPRRVAGARFDWAGAGETLGRLALWLYAGAFLLYTIQWFAVAAWLPTFLVEAQGHSPLAAALYAALVVAANILGNLAGAWLLHRGVPRWGLIALANLVMGATAAPILGAFTPDAAKVPLAFVFSAVSGVLPAAAFSGAAVHAPRPALVAMSSGFLVQGAAIGMLAGPPLMAAVVGSLGGWTQAWWTMLICPALGLAIAAGILAKERG
ncbi:MAG: CynX/NimT family MFS transporter [Alphaproteobacteria bacterium]